MIIRPNHGKAKHFINHIFFATHEFHTFGTQTLITQNGTKKDCIGWNGGEGVKGRDGSENARRRFCGMSKGPCFVVVVVVIVVVRGVVGSFQDQ